MRLRSRVIHFLRRRPTRCWWVTDSIPPTQCNVLPMVSTVHVWGETEETSHPDCQTIDDAHFRWARSAAPWRRTKTITFIGPNDCSRIERRSPCVTSRRGPKVLADVDREVVDPSIEQGFGDDRRRNRFGREQSHSLGRANAVDHSIQGLVWRD